MKKQFIRAAATSVLGLSLMTGFAAADINTTGPGSSNTERTRVNVHHRVNNDNDVRFTNSNSQRAYTGTANVSGNTRGGDAASGYATNDNSLNGSVSVDNNSSAGMGAGVNLPSGSAGDISTTGPGSDNRTSWSLNVDTSVRNDNDVHVTNTSTQTATTGSANVSGNTTGGSAVSGDASNTNNSTFDISITN
jgi:hypothetical protein